MAEHDLPPGIDPENTLVLDTTPGRIVIKLRNDVAPGHAERMKLLAREEFYDDVPFHRVIDGFMAQTGDGENGNGTGGSDHPDLKAEFSDVPYVRGTVGMARTSNPHSANSQFFIMFDEGSFLNGQYTVVGEVVSGMDVVDKLKRGEPPARSRQDPQDAGRVRHRITKRRLRSEGRHVCALTRSRYGAIASSACAGNKRFIPSGVIPPGGTMAWMRFE